LLREQSTSARLKATWVVPWGHRTLSSFAQIRLWRLVPASCNVGQGPPHPPPPLLQEAPRLVTKTPLHSYSTRLDRDEWRRFFLLNRPQQIPPERYLRAAHPGECRQSNHCQERSKTYPGCSPAISGQHLRPPVAGRAGACL